MDENNINLEIATRYIRENFKALGTDSDYVTSADIVREIAEMTTVSLAEITKLMSDAKFEVKFIEKKPYWVVYRE